MSGVLAQSWTTLLGRRETYMNPGEPFNPHGLFHGLFVPEALARYRGLSPGAKLAYGRLVRYGGQKGDCYPAVPTLASEIGVSVRQTQNYLAELERNKLIRRLTRLSVSGQQSNAYQFLWHHLLEAAVKKTAPEGVKDIAPEGVKDSSPKESHLEESHSEDNIDLDYLLTNRQNRDSQAGAGSPSVCRPYPHLREALCQYMMNGPGDERIYPSDRHVVDVMDAAGGAGEEEVIGCLKHLYSGRGLKPGTRNGPRSFAWFITVVQDHFSKRHEREEAANPTGVAAVSGQECD